MTVICEKCQKPMQKRQTINSGNSRYETHLCLSCGHLKEICVGVTQKE